MIVFPRKFQTDQSALEFLVDVLIVIENLTGIHQFLQNKFNMTSMGIIRNFSAKHSRHHHSLFKESSKSDDIASLLGLPGIEDAHKLWNLTSHAKESMIKEVLCPRSLLAEDNNLCREQKSRFHGSLHLPFTLESNCAKMTSFLDFFLR